MLNRLNLSQESSPPAEQAGGFDIRDAVNFVWRRWKLIGGATALAVLIGAVYVARQTPLYTATAQLLLDPRKEKIAGQETIMSDFVLDEPTIQSQMAIITSSALLRRVVDKEHLVNDPEFGVAPSGGNSGSGFLASIRGLFSRSAEPASAPQPPKEQSPTGLDALSPETIATTQNVKGALSVTQALNQGFVLTIAFTSTDPAKAARLANAVADAYVVDKLDARFDAAKRASSWLSDRLVEIRKQLRESEEAVARFRADNNLAQSAPGATLNQEQLGQMNARLVSARSEVAEKKARLDMLQKIEARGGNITALPDTMNSGPIADLRKQENDL
jgi:succinoglycan biosynthesis transport protein ExoP